MSSFFHLELCDIDLQFLSQTDRILNPDSMRQTRLLVIVFRSMQVSEVERESREREKRVLENMQVSAVCRLFSGLD